MAIIATVRNDPIAAIGDARQTGNMTNHFHKGALLRIGGVAGEIRPVNIATLRDHQNVNGRLWIDILEGQRVLILGDLFAGQLTAQDARKWYSRDHRTLLQLLAVIETRNKIAIDPRIEIIGGIAGETTRLKRLDGSILR